MKASRRTFLAGSVAAVSAGVARTAFAQIARPYAQQATIALNVPLTGELAGAGLQVVQGARQAADEANALATALDRVFFVRTFDDQNRIANAVLAAQFAGDDPSAIAAVGHLSGTVTNAVLQQYANAALPLIVPASTLDDITAHGYRNVFRLPTKDSTEGSLFARMLVTSLHPRTVTAVAQDGDYGYAVAKAFTDRANADKMSAQLIIVPAISLDFTSVARRVTASTPEFVFLAGNTAALGALVPALRGAGFKGRIGASQGFYNTTTIELARDLGADAIISTSMPPLDRVANNYTSLANLRGRYGEVTPLMAFGFAATQLVTNAVRRLGATNRVGALRALRNGGFYDTLVGSFSFLLSGDPLDPNLYFYTIADGKFQFKTASHSSTFLL
ncbi:MAG: hypothetical protein DLM50_07095 [Candidatus Meridianibacter frigidus]|nr:MAG: hypothetical protein DLM50_07095 [Candidatus Eremiobacteraeota bacterium]